jgi:hypothetical protein
MKNLLNSPFSSAFCAVLLVYFNLTVSASVKIPNSQKTLASFTQIISSDLSSVSQTSDCTRSTPESIVDQSVFPNKTFSLTDDKQIGTETVLLPGNRKLTITNTGCEYYHLIFQFETADYSVKQIASKDSKFWYKEIVKFLKIVRGGIQAPIQLDKAVDRLNQITRKRERPRFEAEIDYGGTDIRTFFSVQPMQTKEKNKVVLEISFSVGPL